MKRVFTNIEDGIQFFMLVNQFIRVTNEIKRIHDLKVKYADSPDQEDQLKKDLDYYLNEKAVLLGMFVEILLKSIEFVEDKK